MHDLIFSLSFVALLKEHLIYNVSIFSLDSWVIFILVLKCVFFYVHKSKACAPYILPIFLKYNLMK